VLLDDIAPAPLLTGAHSQLFADHHIGHARFCCPS
jgi:hypothetical protein